MVMEKIPHVFGLNMGVLNNSHLDKKNYPENSMIYLNQGYLTIKDNKKLHYTDYYLLGQIIECIKPPEEILNYVCNEREFKIHRQRYDIATAQFLGLYKSLRFLVVRGDPNKHFLDYSYCKKISKILYSYHKRKIPSSFSGTFLNKHKLEFESDTLQTPFSNVYYFLPSTTDRSEEMNRHLGSVHLSPIGIPEKTFERKDNVAFDPSKLVINCQEKEKMSQSVVKMLKKITNLSNSNLTRNADGLFSQKSIDANVKWVGQTKQRLPSDKYKMSY